MPKWYAFTALLPSMASLFTLLSGLHHHCSPVHAALAAMALACIPAMWNGCTGARRDPPLLTMVSPARQFSAPRYHSTLPPWPLLMEEPSRGVGDRRPHLGRQRAVPSGPSKFQQWGWSTLARSRYAEADARTQDGGGSSGPRTGRRWWLAVPARVRDGDPKARRRCLLADPGGVRRPGLVGHQAIDDPVLGLGVHAPAFVRGRHLPRAFPCSLVRPSHVLTSHRRNPTFWQQVRAAPSLHCKGSLAAKSSPGAWPASSFN